LTRRCLVRPPLAKPREKTGQCGSAANFLPGTAAGGDLKGGTGQGGSTADFFPRGHQPEKEAKDDVLWSGGESDEDSAPLEWVVEADQKAMRALADKRSFLGTSASRMASDTRAAEAAPGWTVDRRGRRLCGLATGPSGKPHDSGLSHHRQSAGTDVPGGHERWRPFFGHPCWNSKGWVHT